MALAFATKGIEMVIRPIEHPDIEPLLTMLHTSGQFDDAGLAHVRETLNTYFAGGSDDLWFSADQQGLAGVAYCAPEVMTHGTWNVLMLWISPAHQRQGVGQALMGHIERALSEKQARLLLVETSSLVDFTAARAFYRKQGFAEEARIADYYAAGEDKLIFTKRMQ